MTAQTVEPDALFDMAPLVKAEGATIQQRFEHFHANNGWVYRSFERMAADWLDRGHTHIGMKMLTEVLRYQYGRTVGDRFKLNNSYTSRYVRLLLAAHPEWSDAFETRELRAA